MSVVLYTYTNVCGVIILEREYCNTSFASLVVLFAGRRDPSRTVIPLWRPLYRSGVLDIYGLVMCSQQPDRLGRGRGRGRGRGGGRGHERGLVP